jgi:hypothetical protein
MHEFDDDNKIGMRGEKIFEQYCCCHGISVLRVSDNPEWQKRDVDFLVVGDDGVEYAYEVKNDTRIWKTRNVFYEDVSNVDYRTVGCFEKTLADFIVICSEPEEKMYVVDARRLREYVAPRISSFRRISVVPGSKSSGILVPLDEIAHFVKEYDY